MTHRARQLAGLWLALALSACGHSEGGVNVVTVARDRAGRLHLLIDTSPSVTYFVEGPHRITTRYATRVGGAWRYETVRTGSREGLTLHVADDGRVYIPPPATPALARVDGRWAPLADLPLPPPGTYPFDIADGDLAWTGSDSRLRVYAQGALHEYDGPTRAAVRPLALDCTANRYPIATSCQFVSSGDLSGDLVRLTTNRAMIMRAEHLTLSCDAATCAVSEPRDDFALPRDVEWNHCTLLRTARGAPTLVCANDADLVVTTPERLVARALLPAHRYALTTARATQGVLASSRGHDGRLTLLAVDEDGATRVVPTRVVGVVSEMVPVLGGMSGATEVADLFLVQTRDTIIRLTVSVETGEQLSREVIVVPVDDDA